MAIQLYHLSTDPNLSVMVPRVPNNRLVRAGKENGTIPRICFASSISSALAAAPPARTGIILYVYSPTSINRAAVYKPSTQEVPDSRHTHEVWYLEPTTVKKIGAIIVGDIIRAKYWGTKEEREGHYDLEWYKYKYLKDPKDKKEIKNYLSKQPIYNRKLRAKRMERLKGALGGALTLGAGIAVYNLIGSNLKRVK